MLDNKIDAKKIFYDHFLAPWGAQNQVFY